MPGRGNRRQATRIRRHAEALRSAHDQAIRRADVSIPLHGNQPAMEFILWIIAVILVIWGIITLVRGSVLTGIILIVVGLLVGPGGVSIFT
jgi:hypothetical protein